MSHSPITGQEKYRNYKEQFDRLKKAMKKLRRELKRRRKQRQMKDIPHS